MKALKILGGVVLAFALAILAVVYFLGPSYGPLAVGKPIFLGHDSPKRYARSVLDVSEKTGIYADSPEFDVARARAEDEAKNAKDNASLYPVLNDAVQAAGGKHSRLIPPASESDAGKTDNALTPPSVKTANGVIFATVPEIDRNDDIQGYADTLARGIAEGAESGACGAIVDLRGNGGGYMLAMIAGLSPLLPDGTVLSFESRFGTSNVGVKGTSTEGGGTPISVTGVNQKYTDLPVAVLVDERTASSGEATMLSFRGLEKSRSFGTATRGYASGNSVVDYPDGSMLMITMAKDKARTGETFAEDPIAPDVDSPAAEQAARAWLAERGCKA